MNRGSRMGHEVTQLSHSTVKAPFPPSLQSLTWYLTLSMSSTLRDS